MKAFFKGLLFANGLIWSIFTLSILFLRVSIGETEIISAWIVALLFAIASWRIESKP
jgi:hypothetical protein